MYDGGKTMFQPMSYPDYGGGHDMTPGNGI